MGNKYHQLLSLLVLVSLTFVACSAAVTPAETGQKPAQPAPVSVPVSDWERTLAEARKEGKVVIYGTVGQATREALVQGFKNDRGLQLEFLSGRGSELAVKLMRERTAGLYVVDAFMGGATTMLTDFKPAGLLEPIRPVLMQADVANEKSYFEGRFPAIDKDGLVYQLMLTVIPGTTLINLDMVREAELISYHDLLQPRWKGKIVMNDPSTAGRAQTFFSRTAYLKTLAPRFWADLSKQEPVISRDERAQVEGVAKGKYAVGWAADDESALVFQRAGAPVRYIKFKEDPLPLVSGSENFALLTRPPHENARNVFVNWLLSKEGQTAYARASNRQAVRLDVPTDHLTPEAIRQPGVQYFNSDVEDFIIWRATEGNKQAREAMATVLSK